MERLPTDVLTLRAMLKKLKRREEQLLADLALKEHPELEDGIVAITAAEVLFREADKVLLLADKPELEEGNEEVLTQIRFLKTRKELAETTGRSTEVYDKKLADLKTLLVSTDVVENYEKYSDKRNKALQRLQQLWTKWGAAFLEAEVDASILLPTAYQAIQLEVL